MDTPVSFEIAKLLKEKGFDIPTFYYYEDEKLVEPYLENGSSTDVEFRVDLSDLKEHFNKWSKRISAPTIAEVVIWCFNKYRYSIEYSMNIPESGEYDDCYVFNGLIKGSQDYKLKIFYTSKDYPTIEKALEDTIDYFLVNFC